MGKMWQKIWLMPLKIPGKPCLRPKTKTFIEWLLSEGLGPDTGASSLTLYYKSLFLHHFKIEILVIRDYICSMLIYIFNRILYFGEIRGTWWWQGL